jgi:hypothetical protein
MSHFNLQSYTYQAPSSNPSFPMSMGNLVGLDLSRPRNDWTDQQRIHLLCAFRFFPWSGTQVAEVLNHFFHVKNFTDQRVLTYRNSLRINQIKKARDLYSYIFDEVRLSSPPPRLRRIVLDLKRSARSIRVPTSTRGEENLASELRQRKIRPCHHSQGQIRRIARMNASLPLPRGVSERTDYFPEIIDVDELDRNPGSAQEPASSQIHTIDDSDAEPDWVDVETEDVSLGSKLEEEGVEMVTGLGEGNVDDPFGPSSSNGLSSLSAPNWMNALPLPFRPSQEPEMGQRLTTPTPREQQSQANLPVQTEPLPQFRPTSLFRAYNSDSAGTNGPSGFQAGHFPARIPIPEPILLPDYGLLNDIYHHIYHYHHGSSVISTTNSLVWAVHKAINMKNEVPSYIAFLNHDSMESYTKSYHAEEVIKLLRKEFKTRIPNKYAGYRGTAEWLIWGQIEQQSVVNNVAISKLEDLAKRSVYASTILRLHILRDSTTLGKARDVFLKHRVQLSATALGLVNILLCMDITPSSTKEQVEAMVFVVVQGWALELPHGPEDTNAIIDDTFEAWFCMGSNGLDLDIDEEQKNRLRAAFHEGIETGAANINPTLSPRAPRSGL